MANKIINIIWAIPFAWVAISWLDVIAHQFSGGTDAAWNFFTLAIKLGEMLGNA